MSRGEPAQLPAASHASFSLHALPSSQLAPTAGVCETPLIGSQASAVQGLPSSITTGAPPAQLPESVQKASAVHASPSSQLAPGVGAEPQMPVDGSHESAVQALPSSQLIATCEHPCSPQPSIVHRLPS